MLHSRADTQGGRREESGLEVHRGGPLKDGGVQVGWQGWHSCVAGTRVVPL